MDYWIKQEAGKALFPDIEWNKPERRDLAGRLGIIGGNKLGFMGVAQGYSTSLEAGIGGARVLVPDVLKKSIPKTITDVAFAASNPSGGFAKDALFDMQALGQWASGILMIGDNGKNSETGILFESFIGSYDGPLVITRDAIDIMTPSAETILQRPNTVIVGSFSQLQKIFRAVYYPKMATFSMSLGALVETLHKFSYTYPATILTYHQDQVVIAHAGQVITTTIDSPMQIWRGITAARIAPYLIWNQSKPLEAAATSLINKNNRQEIDF